MSDSAKATKDPRTQPRRELTFTRFQEVLADLEQLRRGHEAGTLVATGNWDAGAIFRHLAIPMECSMDGFPRKPPLFMRLLGRWILRPVVLRKKRFDPGVRLDKRTESAIWKSVPFLEGYTHYEKQLKRLIAGAVMPHAHVIFGPMTQQQWMEFHLKHCALHMSFIWPDGVKQMSGQ